MKPVIDNTQFTESIILKQTPKQQLVREVANWVNCFYWEGMEISDTFEAINIILSKYDINLSELTSVIVDIPELENKKVTVKYQPGETTPQVFHGEVVKVLYRDIAYDFPTIFSILSHPDMSEEQRSMLKMTIWEETKPKIYHRLVLNTQEQGILIIPLLKGVIIEQE